MIDEEHATAARLVYDSAADAYVGFVGTEVSDRTEDAVDRSILGAFVELTTSLGWRRPVGDLGCGPGRVAAFLSRSGVETVGIDVSPELALCARDAHPTIPFAAGQISTLPLVDQCLGGAVCWYSIIYTPQEPLAAPSGRSAELSPLAGRCSWRFRPAQRNRSVGAMHSAQATHSRASATIPTSSEPPSKPPRSGSTRPP